MSTTWFITGTSRGFGREWAEGALERGDNVVLTARDVKTVQPLVDLHGGRAFPLELDVTDHDAVFTAMRAAHDHFGRIDVVINNAGYGQFGMIEEVSECEARAQVETNLFGALWVTQSALPIMREQMAGHLIQVSSIGGVVAFPGLGMYNASKWALEGLSDALAREVEGFGIKVTLVEPAGFRTDWAGASAHRARHIEAYDAVRERGIAGDDERGFSGPASTRRAMLTLVDSNDPPRRLFLGSEPLELASAEYADRLSTWKKWSSISASAVDG